MKTSYASLILGIVLASLLLVACAPQSSTQVPAATDAAALPTVGLPTSAAPTATAAVEATEMATSEATSVAAPAATSTVDPGPSFSLPTAMPESSNLVIISDAAAQEYVAVSYALESAGWKDFMAGGSMAAVALKNTITADQTYFYWVFRQANIMAYSKDSSVDLKEVITLSDGRTFSVDDPKVGKGVPARSYPATFPYQAPSKLPIAVYPKGSFDAVSLAERQAFVDALTVMKDGGDLYLKLGTAVGQVAGYDVKNYTGVYAFNEMLSAKRNLDLAVDAFGLK